MNFFRKFQGKTAKDSMLTLSGNMFSQIISLLVLIIVSRSLTVFNFGLYSIINNISSLVSDMADMGMNGAITKFVAEFRAAGEMKKEEELICYALKRKAINVVIVFVVLILGARPIAKYWLHDSNLFIYVYLIIVTCAFSLFVGAMRSVLQGRQEFNRYFISLISWNIVWVLSIILMVFFGTLTIFSSVLSGAISGAVNLVICSRLTNISYRDIIKKNIDTQIKNKFNSFGNWMLLWALFAILQSKLDVFMLASLATVEQVSFYDIASKVIKPILMVVSSYAQVLNPQFASLSSSKLNDRIRIVMKFIGIITAFILVGIVLIKPIFTFIFDNKYDMAIIPAQLLLIAIIFYVWTVPFNSALYALNKPFIFTLAAFIGLIVTVVGNYLLLGKFGAIGASITYIVAQIVGLVVSLSAYSIVVRKGSKR